jgi:hypothetical protein
MVDHGKMPPIGCENAYGAAVCQLDSFGQVVELDFYKNNLAGPIPKVMVLLPFLHVMYMNKNSLTGPIPSDAIVSMPNFGKLYAQYNALTGTIPAELSIAKNFSTYCDSSINYFSKRLRL